MAKTKMNLSLTTSKDETCDKCSKHTLEVVLVIKSGSRARNDHMIQFVHPSCLTKMMNEVLNN